MDIDYWSVTLTEPSYLSISIATPYGAFFGLEDANGTILNHALGPTANSLAGMSTGYGLMGFDNGLLPAGTYYILVMGNPGVLSIAGAPHYVRCDTRAFGFKDVDFSTPHANEIFWLASSGISTGWNESDGSKTFRPYNIVVRCDMSAFLHRMSDYGLLPAE